MGEALEWLRNLDGHLGELVARHGLVAYALLFLAVWSQTGCVLGILIPGNALLFGIGLLVQTAGVPGGAAGAIAALSLAAWLGNLTHWVLGRWVGPRLFRNPDAKWFRPDRLEKAHAFFERHGVKAVPLACFVPFVRTFLPIAAGMGRMDFAPFALASALGALSWVTVLVGGGAFFGRVPWVRDNFGLLVLAAMAAVTGKVAWDVFRFRVRKQPLNLEEEPV